MTKRKNILLSMIGAMLTLGGMDETLTPSREKKKPTYFGKKTKRTKGRRERSLKSRSNRQKAKRSK